MNSIFIILLTFVSLDDKALFTDPASFGSIYYAGIYESREDCTDALMQIFANTPPENNPSIEKNYQDEISVTTLSQTYLGSNNRNKFVCKEITLK